MLSYHNDLPFSDISDNVLHSTVIPDNPQKDKNNIDLDLVFNTDHIDYSAFESIDPDTNLFQNMNS